MDASVRHNQVPRSNSASQYEARHEAEMVNVTI